MDNSKDIVCVTGGTGFVATHIIKLLLKDGYHVRATVRNLKDKTKYQFLTDLDTTNSLELFEANLTDAGSFDKAVDGSHYVLHTASPYALNVKDPQKDLVDPAVQGTLTVLQSCKKASTVKRVVLTSSMAALTDTGKSGHTYTEADWNNYSSLTRNPYYYSKKLAEEAGWNFMKENEGKLNWDLVVINPFLVIGPELNPTALNPSNQIFQDLMSGKYPGIMSLYWGFVDVRDVAKAHILAMKNKTAKGRYLCCNATRTMEETVKLIKENYGTKYPIPSMNIACSVGDAVVKLSSYLQPKGIGDYLRSNIGKEIKFDNTKIKTELGLEFIDLKQSIYDTIDDLIAKGNLKDLREKKA